MSKRHAETGQMILASQSPYRAAMLESAGIAVTAQAAAIDERAVESPLLATGMDAADIASILALAKAQDVSGRHPGRHVIGADQTLGLDGDMLHKPADMEEARRRLLQLSGRTHQLNSAACIVLDGQTLWSHTETCRVKFRELDPGFVGRHLAGVGDAALQSVGAYHIEGRGAQLVDRIEGDLFSVMGLPLLQLLAALRDLELIDR
ncbi:MAG: Maf family nucleotide pyrophosphatase [Pseudomonadota bacterium]|nr:Maf family nucleotide pyrophosphatase [Pseudomonadota bacterium]